MQCMCQNSLPGIVEFYPGAENGRIGLVVLQGIWPKSTV